MIAEDSSAILMGCGPLQPLGKAVAIENIISQHQAHMVVSDEFFSRIKASASPLGDFLDSIGNLHAQLAAVTQQLLKNPSHPEAWK